MGESSLLKGALFFLCMILVIVLFMPKNCTPAALKPLHLHRKTTTATTTGLHIEQAAPPSSTRRVVYPDGLDAERLQYLVETYPAFAEPKMMTFDKHAPSADASPVLSALQRLSYVETQPDGTWTLSRDGLLNVSGAIDQGTTWSIPVAKRVFLSVDALGCSGDQCTARIVWQWQANNVGQVLQIADNSSTTTVTLTASDHRWIVTSFE